MYTLDSVIENNKKEAIEILKNNQHQINFASALERGVNENEFNNSDIDPADDLPCVILDCGNGPFNVYVLAARTNDDNTVDILTYDPEENYTEWCESYVCCSYTENNVYLAIEKYKYSDNMSDIMS